MSSLEDPEGAGQSPPVDVEDPPQTGDVALDAAMLALSRAAAGSLADQVAAYDAAHRTLQDRLADVEG